MTALPPVTLILGGARSGKSRYAEQLVESYDRGLYLATAQAVSDDREMAERIALHKKRRGDFWQTIEEPLDIANIITGEANAERPILVDCLTLWLSNLMFGERDLDAETVALTEALAQTKGPVVLVSNEVGLGIVPDNALARRFRDCAGRLNQVVAGSADRVVFMAAGLTMIMKDETT
jgi:adenosylcobinamide kinase / adenosylcobinamide-phosphate guanylyltransferase